MSAQGEPTGQMRLQRFIARAGGPGRRASERLIAQGRVQVNGQVVDQMGVKVDPASDEVRLDGRLLTLPDATVVVALNKPAGYECSMRPETGHPSAAALVPTERYKGLVHVGRLDVATTGLILFTNDGDLCARLLMPRYGVVKSYRAVVWGTPSASDLARLRAGVRWHDVQYAPPKVEVAGTSEDGAPTGQAHARRHGRRGAREGATTLLISVHEGHNHEVRNMCSAVGHPVKSLTRLSFGPVDVKGLALGKCRTVTGEELSALYEAAGLDGRMQAS